MVLKCRCGNDFDIEDYPFICQCCGCVNDLKENAPNYTPLFDSISEEHIAYLPIDKEKFDRSNLFNDDEKDRLRQMLGQYIDPMSSLEDGIQRSINQKVGISLPIISLVYDLVVKLRRILMDDGTNWMRPTPIFAT